jgi:hypothetical protein
MGKYQDFAGISLNWIIVEGYCRWKLSSGNFNKCTIIKFYIHWINH